MNIPLFRFMEKAIDKMEQETDKLAMRLFRAVVFGSINEVEELIVSENGDLVPTAVDKDGNTFLHLVAILLDCSWGFDFDELAPSTDEGSEQKVFTNMNATLSLTYF